MGGLNASKGLGDSGRAIAANPQRMSEGLGRSVGIPNMGQIEEEQDDDELSSRAHSHQDDHHLDTGYPRDSPDEGEVAASRHSINEG